MREMRRNRRLKRAKGRNGNKRVGLQVCPTEKLTLSPRELQ